ncbi:hypothetical protein KOR42_55000 [Thalassoglobus neptunius]|uniref:Uncharacterized protein n=1 Tax=Thalassoglobus neptunius TaxID=1938619 RepID=A0A5C5UW63_9PLAN|nr:hypothetical protein [Thalassoglobus neptunius]TWT29797.1 hypothetical protein KOR42_55000 [Thalassoglobus neptunius]
MNRVKATSIILAEAFAENGLVMLVHQGDDPGFQRMDTLISAVNFLADDLRRVDTLNRMLVSALFALGTQVPEDLRRGLSPIADSRCSLFRQSVDLHIAVTRLIENWENWPSQENIVIYKLQEPSAADLSGPSGDEEFEGYHVGDITYCIVCQTEDFFPVKVVRLGFNVIEVEAHSTDICRDVCEMFLEERLNRCFQSPTLPSVARFGGFDERPVNTARRSGPELRLLPYHYRTTTVKVICQHHKNDPESWPLPTGTVFERWFK